VNKELGRVCKGSFEGSVTDCFASSLAQAVQLTISVGILFSYALQMYVPIEILWPHVQKRWGRFKNSSLIDIIFRSSLVLITCKYVTYFSFSYKICVT
jgi:proton-coupled amino acid transporter